MHANYKSRERPVQIRGYTERDLKLFDFPTLSIFKPSTLIGKSDMGIRLKILTKLPFFASNDIKKLAKEMEREAVHILQHPTDESMIRNCEYEDEDINNDIDITK